MSDFIEDNKPVLQDNSKILEWMHQNAPESIRNLPDEELIPLMSDAWTAYTSQNLLSQLQCKFGG